MGNFKRGKRGITKQPVGYKLIDIGFEDVDLNSFLRKIREKHEKAVVRFMLIDLGIENIESSVFLEERKGKEKGEKMLIVRADNEDILNYIVSLIGECVGR